MVKYEPYIHDKAVNSVLGSSSIGCSSVGYGGNTRACRSGNSDDADVGNVLPLAH